MKKRLILHSIFREMVNIPTLKQRLIAIFFTILLIVYVGNTTVFIHEHEVGGVKIVHSHPYSSSHNHTTNSITAISLLSHVVALVESFSCEIDVAEQLLCVLEQKQELLCDVATAVVIFLRAPPIL